MEKVKAFKEIVVEFIKRAPKDSPYTPEQIVDFMEKCVLMLSKVVIEDEKQPPESPLGRPRDMKEIEAFAASMPED